MSDSSPNPSGNPYQSPAFTPTESIPANYIAGTFDKSKYRSVRSGLRMMYYGITLMLLGFVLFLIVSGIFPITMGGASTFMILILTALAIVLGLTIFIGFFLCTGAPHPNEKFKAQVSVGLQIVSFLSGFAGAGFISASGMSAEISTIAELGIQLVGNLLGFISTIFFILFCKQVGTNIGSEKLVNSSKSVLNWFLTMAVGFFIFIGVTFAIGLAAGGLFSQAPQGMLAITGAFAIVFVIVAIITLVKYLNMMRTGFQELT